MHPLSSASDLRWVGGRLMASAGTGEPQVHQAACLSGRLPSETRGVRPSLLMGKMPIGRLGVRLAALRATCVFRCCGSSMLVNRKLPSQAV